MNPDLLARYLRFSETLSLGFLLVFGAVQCFYGYRLFKQLMAATGFFAGAVVGGGIAYNLSQNGLYVLAGGVGGGMIGAVLFVALYFTGVFVSGAFLGVIIAVASTPVVGQEPRPAVVLVLAVVSGVVALVVERLMIIVSTAFTGATSMVAAASWWIHDPYSMEYFSRRIRAYPEQFYAEFIALGLLGAVGVLVQYDTVPVVRFRSVEEPDQSTGRRRREDADSKIDRR